MADIKFSEWVSNNLTEVALPDVDGSQLIVAVTGEGIPCVIRQANVKTGAAIIARAENNTIDGWPSGTIFTDEGSSETVQLTFGDSPIGTEYTFFVTDNAIELRPGDDIGHTIQFWDGSTSRDTGFVLLGSPGMSITIKKITSTKWAAIAVNGAVDND